MHPTKFILFFIIGIGLFSCNSEQNKISINPPQIGMNDTLHVVKEFKGLYSDDGTHKIFISCDDPKRLHLVESKNYQLDTLYNSVLQTDYAGPAIYLEFTAEIAPSPDSAFSDLLIAKTFLKAERAENGCAIKK